MNVNERNKLPINERKNKLDTEILKFTLSLYENTLLPKNAVDSIISDFNTFLSNTFIPYLQNQVEIELKSTMDNKSYYKTQFILEENKNLFENLKSEHLRFKLYEEKSTYIAPQNFEVGEDLVFEHQEENVEVQEKKVYATHVPLDKTLKAFLERPGIFHQIMNYINHLAAETTNLSNVMQGSLWLKKYVPKTKDKIVLPLFLYFDEFEVGNALGSHAGEQKMGGTYVSLACLPPHLFSKLQNIFVSTICYAKHLKMFKNHAIFKKTIQDLNRLSQEGISIIVEEVEYKIYFECVLLLGDNLGLNSICGFAESFIAKRYCRICSATFEQCQNMTVKDERFLRTPESYNLEVLINDFSNTGIKEKCVFNEIINFHIIENPSVDVMHDFCEGIAEYSIGSILDILIRQKIISLNVINARIESFPYGNSEI